MRCWKSLDRFLGSESGAALVYVMVALPVLVGILGLSLDLQRVMTLNSELQDIADASAMAGALELDRRADAITRATAAAQSLLDNPPKSAGDAAPAAQLSALRFYDQDRAVTADGRFAAYIQVWASPRTAPSTFIRFLADDAGDIATGATAIAGRSQVACNVTPMMMCIPADPNRFTRGALFGLKEKNGQLGPGAFALLDPPGTRNSGANQTQVLLAATAPGFCFVNNTSVATGGRTSSITAGLNVRFDMYPNGNGGPNGAVKQYPPAPNVTKGYRLQNVNNCQHQAISGNGELMAFPNDACFAAGTCYMADRNRLGDGNWDRAAYWNRNHATKTKPAGYDQMTRFEVYLWELGITNEAQTPSSYANMPAKAGARENPRPMCKTTPEGSPSRRVIYVAVSDCTGITGNATPDLQSARYGKFFLTRPSDSGEVFAEFIGWVEPNDDTGILKNIVNLVHDR